ncbi:MAG TPA: ArsB/NhaD family transporter [Candidatus Hydrogenedentes bacterium]|nr:ArsB/NhaD family transporter [Candidatus Hydrogenedentota bacterium]HOL76475.1 ArsB/NhaD family transporter [Candidatus Hydrogenedentota bacterium]HPO85139.1 ArsB/NhaD family transporter [Candidatus Hydrogenedentota bacterium]
MISLHLLLSVLIFLVTYVAILSNKVDKSIAAIIGGMAMILLHVVDEHTAYASIDLSVIFLLIGMMIITHFLAKSGFFGYVALRLVQVAEARPVPVMVVLCIVTGVLSALVDNVTTVLLIAPVTFLMAEQAEIDPIPFLIFEVMAANIGGTATLIGDPPNILIGSQAGLTFNEFIIHVTPPAALCLVASVAGGAWIVRRQPRLPADARAHLMEMKATGAISDWSLLVKSGTILIIVLTLFVFHDMLGLGPAPIALGGAAVLILLTREDSVGVFQVVEWPMLFFFIGLFVTISGLVSSGAMDLAAKTAIALTGNSLFVTTLVLLWFSAIASALVGAIPVVAALIPIVKNIIPDIQAHSASVNPQTVSYALWWALSLGACLGGNGTILGAACNIVAVEIARSNRRTITPLGFMRVGLPVALVSLLISTVYIILRYLR